MTTAVEDEDGFTELRDASVPRVDGVSAAANGTPWFFAKQAEEQRGLLDPDFVRELIAKSDLATEAPRAGETVTMSGSPAAIAALIHGAPVRKAAPVAEPDEIAKSDYEALVKAKYNADDLKRMAANGQAMKDESYPIADKEDLDRAIHAVGRGGSGHDAIRRHIVSRAKSLGASSEIPDTWASDGSLKKAMNDMDTSAGMPTDDGMDGMDPTVVLAAPDEDCEATGDTNDPGSPAWEAIDAATARKWTAIAARLRSALGVMSDRESLEAATVDPGDAEAACDLQDAALAVDYAISVLAAFAVDEQAEADDAVMAAVGKSIGALDVAHLDTVESLGTLRKAGRTLSAANEGALRSAITALQQILASLPKAPDADQVAKTANEEPNMAEPALTEDVTAASGQQPAMGAAPADPKPVAGAVVTDVAKQTAPARAPAPVVKAEKTPQVAIYDANGNLVGTVDPAEITMLAPAKAPEPAAKSGDAAPDEPAAPAAQAPDAPPTDLTPAPAASVGTPADAVPADDDTVAKAAGNSTTEDRQNVLKSDVAQLVKAALSEHSAQQGELIKGLEDRNVALEEQNAALVKQAASLEERLTRVENQPAVMAIASNGAIPPAHQMRGQNRGGQVDMTEGQSLRKQLAESDDVVEKTAIANRMQQLAIDRFTEMRAQPRQPR